MGIGGSMGVNQTAQGVLAGAFMGGYCVFSPVFAYLASTDMAPFSLVGTGLSVWLVAALLGAFSPHYGGLLAARVLSGVGEASFQCIAPCFLDDVAPAEQKGCCTPAEQKGCCTPATTFLLLPHENSISVGSRQFLAAAACPPAAASTLIHSVQLVRRDGRDVSTLYGRGGGGGGLHPAWRAVLRAEPRARAMALGVFLVHPDRNSAGLRFRCAATPIRSLPSPPPPVLTGHVSSSPPY